jgi:hypothetical protein
VTKTQQLAKSISTLYRKLYPKDGSLPTDPVLIAARQSEDERHRLLFSLLSHVGEALMRQEQVIMLIAEEHSKIAQGTAPIGQTQGEALEQAVDMESSLPATQATVTSMMPAVMPGSPSTMPAAVANGGMITSVSAPVPAVVAASS